MFNPARAALALLLAAAASGAWAQAAKPTDGNTKAADTSAEAAAAMQRAQRLAANPMRVILEAGKFRRKSAEAEPAPEPADGANLRRTAARTGAAEAPRSAAVEVAAVNDEVITPRSVPAAKVPPPVAAPLPAVEPAQAILSVGNSLASTGPAPAAVAALESAHTPAGSLAALPKAAAPLAELAASLAKPKLVSTVEPVMPARFADDAARLTEVQADITIRPDGSVASVALLSNVPRGLQRPITVAMEQWKFAPLPDTRVHRVQLVFNDNK